MCVFVCVCVNLHIPQGKINRKCLKRKSQEAALEEYYLKMYRNIPLKIKAKMNVKWLPLENMNWREARGRGQASQRCVVFHNKPYDMV